ncbi:T9SS type A sorting domain-containing protein [Proteiniphilum sp. X52]|uniref:T9SS type A sorting domain-containing protein n=1 Tax=Proteiniphilum sp. X52 TaxID=2382159 RepID=UPI000F09D40B|nr:T9SS type A sorting domain-containing protein [Proteiniphilum sp. X52]RNC64907.1 T9SS C-terminal target domain-containing protein [Proteiniphilum sp. X52]
MKRCYSFLLMIYLISGTGLPLSAQGNSGGPGMEGLQNRLVSPDTVKTQNREGFQNTGKLQDTTRIQNRQGSQNREDPQDKTTIKLTGNQLLIENLPEDGVLEIYNIMGVKVYHRLVKAGTNQYILSLSRGYYIIKIGKITRKVAVK